MARGRAESWRATVLSPHQEAAARAGWAREDAGERVVQRDVGRRDAVLRALRGAGGRTRRLRPSPLEAHAYGEPEGARNGVGVAVERGPERGSVAPVHALHGHGRERVERLEVRGVAARLDAGVDRGEVPAGELIERV